MKLHGKYVASADLTYEFSSSSGPSPRLTSTWKVYCRRTRSLLSMALLPITIRLWFSS